MPTARPRHVITETDDVAQALDDARSRWPEDRANRRKLLQHLLEAGHLAIRAEGERQFAQRRAAVAKSSGLFTGAYDELSLSQLREDWPE